MAFRKFLSSLGVNAPHVDTVLDRETHRPGEQLNATVTLRGGGADVEIEKLRLEVVSRFEARETTAEWNNPGLITSWQSEEPFQLAAGKEQTIPVAIQLPWEMPLTHILNGRRLKGARVAVRTELAIDNAVDRGDFDEFAVHALTAQDTILQAYSDLGFRFDEAEVKRGTPRAAVASKESFWQEIEMWYPSVYKFDGNQVEIAFNAREDSLDLLTGGSGRLSFSYADMDVERCREAIDTHYRERMAAGR